MRPYGKVLSVNMWASSLLRLTSQPTATSLLTRRWTKCRRNLLPDSGSPRWISITPIPLYSGSLRGHSGGGKKGKPVDWMKAVSEAESLVGYPTSFMSLRLLLSDELSNVALQMRKLVGTNHPLLGTAREFVSEGKHSVQTRGLLVLLLSKAAGPAQQLSSDITETMVSGIYPRQRALAEITEMIYTANLIHKGVINLDRIHPADGSPDDLHLGNKMAVLSGDFLLASASKGLAELQNTYVVELISTAIGDLTCAEFTRFRDSEGNICLPRGQVSMGDWEHQTLLSGGSLLAYSCQSALMLANHRSDLQKNAFDFGKNIALAYQLHQDLRPFLALKGDLKSICVTSAPVILSLSNQQCGTQVKQLLQDSPFDQTKLHETLADSSVVEEARQCCVRYGDESMQALEQLPSSDAKDALHKIAKAVSSV